MSMNNQGRQTAIDGGGMGDAGQSDLATISGDRGLPRHQPRDGGGGVARVAPGVRGGGRCMGGDGDRGGRVVHSYGDHASVLKFIERNWRLAPLTNRSRDNLPNPITAHGNPYVPLNMPAIGDLFDMFDFGAGRGHRD